MRNATTIMIPTERHHQLAAIGSALNLSMAETVARLVRSEIAAGTIPADLPGIKVERVADAVRVTIDDNTETTYSKGGAVELADAIERASSGKPMNVLDLDADFAVERRGNGVKVSVPFTGTARAFSRDVAADLAALIRAAAE